MTQAATLLMSPIAPRVPARDGRMADDSALEGGAEAAQDGFEAVVEGLSADSGSNPVASVLPAASALPVSAHPPCAPPASQGAAPIETRSAAASGPMLDAKSALSRLIWGPPRGASQGPVTLDAATGLADPAALSGPVAVETEAVGSANVTAPTDDPVADPAARLLGAISEPIAVDTAPTGGAILTASSDDLVARLLSPFADADRTAHPSRAPADAGTATPARTRPDLSWMSMTASVTRQETHFAPVVATAPIAVASVLGRATVEAASGPRPLAADDAAVVADAAGLAVDADLAVAAVASGPRGPAPAPGVSPGKPAQERAVQLTMPAAPEPSAVAPAATPPQFALAAARMPDEPVDATPKPAEAPAATATGSTAAASTATTSAPLAAILPPAFQIAARVTAELAAAPPGAPAPAAPVTTTTTTTLSSGGTLKVLTVELQPHDLGKVVVHLELRQDAISVKLETAHRETARAIEKDRDVIAQTLKSAGYIVDGVSTQTVDQRAPLAPSVAAGADAGANSGGLQRESSGAAGDERRHGGHGSRDGAASHGDRGAAFTNGGAGERRSSQNGLYV